MSGTIIALGLVLIGLACFSGVSTTMPYTLIAMLSFVLVWASTPSLGLLSNIVWLGPILNLKWSVKRFGPK